MISWGDARELWLMDDERRRGSGNCWAFEESVLSSVKLVSQWVVYPVPSIIAASSRLLGAEGSLNEGLFEI